MDLSLDDIIKNKRIAVAPSKKFINKKHLPIKKPLRALYSKQPVFKEAQRFTDARQKIIQKNRAKIRDARDKLAEITRASGDARQRLLRKQHITGISLKTRSYRNGHIGGGGGRAPMREKLPKSYQMSASIHSGLPDLVDVPRGYVDYDNMERMEEEEYAAASRLSRTVTNDLDLYPSYGSDSRDALPSNHPSRPRRLNSWGSTTEPFDPFDVYEVPHNTRHERRHVSRMSPDNLQLPPAPPKGILRSSSASLRQHSPTDLYQRRFVPEPASHLSYEMRSRLEHAPDPHASMGIFAKEPTGTSVSSGHRIVVSNLHASVSQSDIKELFEDIGELYDSRIVRPGVAEVIYKSLNDAEKAVDTYHNRQLDGLPMKCLLVNPRASSKPTAPAIKTSSSSSSSRLTSGKTPLEIDIDALHKVLFRRH